MSDTIDEAIRISREMDPETWAKVDHIAALIDPGSFPTGEIVRIGYQQSELDKVRHAYMQSKARATAWEILRYVGVVPQDFDWTPILQRMAAP